jgi:hypothetical protein
MMPLNPTVGIEGVAGIKYNIIEANQSINTTAASQYHPSCPVEGKGGVQEYCMD